MPPLVRSSGAPFLFRSCCPSYHGSGWNGNGDSAEAVYTVTRPWYSGTSRPPQAGAGARQGEGAPVRARAVARILTRNTGKSVRMLGEDATEDDLAAFLASPLAPGTARVINCRICGAVTYIRLPGNTEGMGDPAQHSRYHTRKGEVEPA
jgi:hypothetical protein